VYALARDVLEQGESITESMLAVCNDGNMKLMKFLATSKTSSTFAPKFIKDRACDTGCFLSNRCTFKIGSDGGERGFKRNGATNAFESQLAQ
jgi:hypothetical protein